MLYGDEDIASDEEPEPKREKKSPKKKEKVHTKQVHTKAMMPSIIINTGDPRSPPKRKRTVVAPKRTS